jgi:hypothetical protein
MTAVRFDPLPAFAARLVDLDSVLVESRRSAFSCYPPAQVDARIKAEHPIFPA